MSWRKWFPASPTLRELPRALFAVIVFGAATGPVVSLFIGWMMSVPWERQFGHPFLWFAYSCLIGAIFAFSFYATCALPMGYMKAALRGFPPWLSRTVLVLTAMAGGAAGCLLSILGVESVLGAHMETPLPLGKLALIDGIIAVVISFIIGAFTKLRADKELRERTLSEQAAKAQTYALQAQINPHFFFNTLNTISALIPIDAKAAQETVGQLADMFRYTLSCSRSGLVRLDEELDFVRSYLSLEQARFRDRLKFELPSPEATRDILLPGLTLQPIVENAVRYGIAKRIEGGTVRVAVDRDPVEYRLTVSNQFDRTEGMPDLQDDTVFRAGHALANIRERLSLAFHGAAGLSIAVNGSDWVNVTVKLPVRSN
jgi:hypothetical protein